MHDFAVGVPFFFAIIRVFIFFLFEGGSRREYGMFWYCIFRVYPFSLCLFFEKKNISFW